MDTRVLRHSQIIILGVCIGVATIGASVILAQAFLRVTRLTKEVITVTGSANQQIASDWINWSATVTVRDPDLVKASQQLGAQFGALRKYLLEQGVAESELTVYAVAVQRRYRRDQYGNDTDEFIEYALSQTVAVNSLNVAGITRVSREVTGLMEQGIEIVSAAPSYFYRNLDGLKVEMLARATENAKQRAEQMARAAGNRIGLLRSARMGVFQITPVTSTDVSDYGVNDTASWEKKVTAVVSASFAIE